MSTWYQVDVTAFGNNSDLARMLHLDEDDITGDTSFTISCGRKNMPGIQYPKMIKNNPNLVFLISKWIECHYVDHTLVKYNPWSDNFSEILLEISEANSNSFNKKLWKEYSELNTKFSIDKIIDWKYFVSRYLETNIPKLIQNFEQYTDMIFMSMEEDDILISNNDYDGDEL